MDALKGGNDNYQSLPTQPPPTYPYPQTEHYSHQYPQTENQVPLSNYRHTQPVGGPPPPYGGYVYRNRYRSRRCIYFCAAAIVIKIVVILVVLAVVLHWGHSRDCSSNGENTYCT